MISYLYDIVYSQDKTLSPPPPLPLTMTAPSHSFLRLFAALLLLIHTPVYAEGYGHDGGLWGSIKEPIRDTVKEKYDGLSDKGRFCVGMGVGFGCTKMVIRTTVRAAKTVGAAYIAFEAMEYVSLECLAVMLTA